MATCTLFDESLNETVNVEETILSASQVIEISKATKVINALALQEILKNESFAGDYFETPEVKVRSQACPNISPDPQNYNPLVKTNYTLQFDQCAISDQLIGVAGTPIVVGEINISLVGELGHSGCEFRIFGKDLIIGTVRYNEYDITQIHRRQITSDTCVKRDIIDFATIIDALEFTAVGISEFGEENDIMRVVSSSNARTRYRDFKCNTDLNDFASIIDDKIVLQADTIVSGFVDNGSVRQRNIFVDVAAEFDLICPCPVSQSFNIVRGGTTTLTCFDFDNTVCGDDVTCLTTTIPLDCRY